MKQKPESHTQLIKERLLEGKGLSPIWALHNFGCFRLAARIRDLRNEGMNIKTIMTGHGNLQFAYYILEEAHNQKMISKKSILG